MEATHVLGVIVLLGITLHTGSCIKCYDCMNCDEPFSAADTETITDLKLVDCASCTKTILKDTVARTCLPIAGEDGCSEKDGAEVCVCSTDLCNAASVTMATPKLVCILVVIYIAACMWNM